MEKLKEWWGKLSTQEKIALVVVVVGVAGYALYRRSKSSSSTSSAPNGGASVGQAVDQYGNPLYPTNLGGLYSNAPGGTYSTGSGSGGSGLQIVPAFKGTPSTPQQGTVRASTGSSYDKQYGGVAEFATPATNAFGGHNVGFLPFGSNVQILGEVQGTPYSDTSGGSNLYYLTPGGYINAQDIRLG